MSSLGMQNLFIKSNGTHHDFSVIDGGNGGLLPGLTWLDDPTWLLLPSQMPPHGWLPLNSARRAEMSRDRLLSPVSSLPPSSATAGSTSAPSWSTWAHEWSQPSRRPSHAVILRPVNQESGPVSTASSPASLGSPGLFWRPERMASSMSKLVCSEALVGLRGIVLEPTEEVAGGHFGSMDKVVPSQFQASLLVRLSSSPLGLRKPVRGEFRLRAGWRWCSMSMLRAGRHEHERPMVSSRMLEDLDKLGQLQYLS